MSTRDSDAARARSRLGTVVRGKYRLDAILGVGGMAVVYKATHRNRAEFALKMLFPELSRDRELHARFLREGYAANSVKHPGVVRVVDDDVADDGAAFIVMELLDGVSVEDLSDGLGGLLPVPIAVAIGVQVLDVLAAAHAAGIVHRDIKPANLFVTRDGVVKVLDFGIARVRDAAMTGPSATRSGMAFGTPAFMAPEQAMAKASLVNETSDLWSLGAALFTMMSGQIVHAMENAAQIMISAATRPARSLAAVAPDVPLPITSVVDRALAFEQESRWRTAAEMRDALRQGFRAAYGEDVPSSASLASLCERVAPSAAVHTDLSNLPTVPAQPRTADEMTGVPVATDVRPTRTHTRAVAFTALAAIAVVAAAVVVTMSVRASRDERSATSAAIGVPNEASSAAIAAPSGTATGSAAPSPAASLDAPESIAATALPVASAPPARPRSAPTATAPRPSATSVRPAPQCNPNYTLDAEGNKHFKPECF